MRDLPPKPRMYIRGSTLAVLVLIGTALRLSGLNTELWFDEIASVRGANTLRALWADHTDNKHHLIWVWLWLTGPGRDAWVYRLPSLLAGAGVLPLMYAVARLWGRPTALLALVLATFCYPLICYSSEARGYALAVLCGVAAYAVAARAWDAGSEVRRSPESNALPILQFTLTVVAGFLSHLTFAYVYAGLLAWAAVEVVNRPKWWATAMSFHAPAAVAVAALWWFDVSRMRFAGGPPTAVAAVVRWTVALTVGTPTTGVLPWAVVGAVVVLCGVGLVTVGRRQGAGPVAFFIVALVVAPVVLTITRRTPFLAVRYYLVCVPFVLLLVAVAARRWVALVVTAAVVVQGLLGAWQLHGLGRGHVREALAHMAADGGGRPITFASERPLMDRVSIAYYAGIVPGRPSFVDQSEPTSPPPRWWILDTDGPFQRGPPTIRRRGQTYRLDAVYPSDPVSGLTWDVYRRAGD